MSNFQIKSSLDLIRERDPAWIDVPTSESVDEFGRPVGVDFAGTKYRLIIRERNFSCLERTGRGLVGVIAIIGTLGMVLIFDRLFDDCLGEYYIRELFQKKITRRFGIRVFDGSVPIRWHQDLILQKFLCAISGIPMLSPIADPHVSTELYDQYAIVPWVVEHRTSPVTAMPIAPYEICLTGKNIIKGLIHYRIEQLKLCENQLGCELNNRDEIHKKLMKDSALELNRQIMLLLKKPPEETLKEMEEIPPFLNGANAFWNYRCAETGKPVLKSLVPRLSDDMLEQDRSLLDICYEERNIEQLLITTPSRMPVRWPSQHLPFTREGLHENPYVQNTIKHQIIVALNELRQYYKPITP